MWQMDHCLLDVLVLDEKQVTRKPWLTIIIDDCSRAICGFYLSLDYPCSMNTALALRQAIWKKNNPRWLVSGIPQILYTDNGSDFISEQIEKLCASLKIRLVHSIPGRPQGKGKVERFFLTLLNQLLEGLPSYYPNNSLKPTSTIDLSHLSQLVEAFIIEEYHQTIHQSTQITPIEKWSADSFLPQLPTSIEELDLLLLTVPTRRKIHRDGIYFNRLRYMNTLLGAFVGETIEIRYDPRDIAEIHVFWEGSFLCNAICQEFSDQQISLKEIKKARQAIKRGYRKKINTAQKLLKTGKSSTVNKKIKSKQKKSTIKYYRNDQ